MPQAQADPVTDAEGTERHPAFGIVSLHRIHATPGAVLFQSDVRHPEYVKLEVHEATRQRNLKHDWVHARKQVLEVSMSMAQFASFIASAGTEGVPCTIGYASAGSHEAGLRPGLNPESRLALTTQEVRAAASQAYAGIMEAFKSLEQAMGQSGAGSAAARRNALRDLRASIANAAPNVAYAARKLDEHAEEVVEKSRADIEAMVTRMAERAGIPPAEVMAIAAGQEEAHEEEAR